MTRTLFPDQHPLHTWVLVNAVGAMVAVAGLVAAGGLDAVETPVVPVLAAGGAWGALQWWALERMGVRVGAPWIGMTALGWLLAIPVLGLATGLVAAPPFEMRDWAREYGWSGPGGVTVTVGFFLHMTLLSFFGLFCGLALAAPQAAWLLLRARTRPLAKGWLGGAVWGWTCGLVFGGVMTTFLSFAVSQLPGAFEVTRGIGVVLAAAVAGAGLGLLVLSERDLEEGQRRRPADGRRNPPAGV